MKVTGITATPATALMKKLKEAELIEPVRNHGRGKYKFTEPLNEQSCPLSVLPTNNGHLIIYIYKFNFPEIPEKFPFLFLH